ncbi:MAG TPA: methyltransferase domain-containing protein [Rhizomicrobium sp.]|nr:methyltransferase domain-containing protein [Rhizomicrobium sp.]
MRALTPEILDFLAPDDPRAMRSRRDLARINGVMRQSTIMAKALAACPQPRLLADLGGGDGQFLLRVARRLGWSGVKAVILDRQSIVSEETRAGFAALGWSCETLQGDIFETLPQLAPDIVTANLFLHHLDDAALQRLLALVASRGRAFVACEPRRAAFALLGARLVFALGANHVTRHDAVASVRAGFRDLELSLLWPKDRPWICQERAVFPFSQVFRAHAL